MLDIRELYTQAVAEPIKINGVVYGTTHIRYEVRQITDVRNLRTARAYRITCTQRIVIPNLKPWDPTPSGSTQFTNYPALLTSRFKIAAGTASDQRLLGYTPRTMNTAIMTSASQSDGKTNMTSQQHTAGSSISQTNTYSDSVSLGFFGDAPTGSVSHDQSNSRTTEQNYSRSMGAESGASQERSGSESMSIKDWASYSFLDIEDNTSPTWVWGQEYPWDVIQFRYCPSEPPPNPPPQDPNQNTNDVLLPQYVMARLFNTDGNPDPKKATTIVVPPSQLSLFGIDFTMKAAWHVSPAAAVDQSVTIHHAVRHLTASHGLEDKKPTEAAGPEDKKPYVRLFPIPGEYRSSAELDLTLLGLDPVRDGGSDNGAVIGFIASKFIVPPTEEGALFKIISEANTLQVTGTGFTAALSTDFSKGAVTLTIQFKIIDDTVDYVLFMKHWKTAEAGCELKFVFNGDQANPVFRHVDGEEGEGGDDNLSTVALRNRDYTSIDYHDYLVLGLNTIDVTITPETSTSAASGHAGYLLRAIAIGES